MIKTNYSKLLAGLCFLSACFAVHALADELTMAARISAIKAVSTNAPECKSLGDFYWEVGDSQSARASGAVGTAFTAQKIIPIASASKWLFGSYVLEKIGTQAPSAEQVRALNMTSGYTGLEFMRCILPRTVAACFHNRGNDEFVAANVGKFFYNGGHDQKLAIDLGLGDLTAKQLGEEVRKYIGSDLAIDFNTPQPAGGMKASPADYGKFLRKILRGELRMHDYLGFERVCVNPQTCKQALSSPIAIDWHYSLNHWVEDGSGGDGAFSSAGAFGFYPWISADKNWYGILARENRRAHAGRESAACGAIMRRAWMGAQ